MPNPHETCHHCAIEIDPKYDMPARGRVDGEAVIICDSCHNDYLVYGESFGDDVRGECLHTKWAAEDAAEQRRREGTA